MMFLPPLKSMPLRLWHGILQVFKRLSTETRRFKIQMVRIEVQSILLRIRCAKMGTIYMYVVDRDFGFAPNPFHGICTLATCKPAIRRNAKIGDWVIGVGGRRLNATGKCIYAMQVSEIVTFEQYWNEPRFSIKKPMRNGSQKMLVGDNIYSKDGQSWVQLDSHHSNPDGSMNFTNLRKDTSANSVLISNNFYYFGASSVSIPQQILQRLGYKNKIGHWKFSGDSNDELLSWLATSGPSNRIIADPTDFIVAANRYSGLGSKILSA